MIAPARNLPDGCRPVTDADYDAWLAGYRRAGGRVTHTYPHPLPVTRFAYVHQDTHIPAARGPAAKVYIVGEGVNVTYDDLGHNQLLHMDDFRITGVPVVAKYAEPVSDTPLVIKNADLTAESAAPSPAAQDTAVRVNSTAQTFPVSTPYTHHRDLTKPVSLLAVPASGLLAALGAFLGLHMSDSFAIFLPLVVGLIVTLAWLTTVERFGRSHITPWLYRTFDVRDRPVDPTYQALLDRSEPTEHGDPHTIIDDRTPNGETVVRLVRVDHGFDRPTVRTVTVTVLKTVTMNWTVGSDRQHTIIRDLADEARQLETQSELDRVVQHNLQRSHPAAELAVSDLETEFHEQSADLVRRYR